MSLAVAVALHAEFLRHERDDPPTWFDGRTVEDRAQCIYEIVLFFRQMHVLVGVQGYT